MMNLTGTVIICCNVYPPRFIGGAELIAHYQAKELQKLGWKVIVFTGDPKPQSHRHDMTHDSFDGIDVFRIYLTHQDYHYEYVNFYQTAVDEHFRTLLKRYNPDVVHLHNIIGLSLGIISLAKTCGAKTVLTVHDHWGFCFKNTLIAQNGKTCTNISACRECLPAIEDSVGRHLPMRLRQDFITLAMRKIDAFISPSAYLAKTYISAGFPQKQFHVVWNGIDINKFQQISRKSKPGFLRLTFCGFLGKHKGLHTLLEALPMIKDNARVRVNLVGDGDQKESYKAILEANGCLSLVRFWGKLDNREIDRAYAETDVLVLPSIWQENQPVSITEAMAAGIPVLASRMGGIVELIEEGVTGFLFDAGNAGQIAAIIDRLLQEPTLIVRLGQNAAKQMALHDYSRQVQKLLSIYQLPLKSGKKNGKNERLIICIGQRFSLPAFSAISSDRVFSTSTTYRFLHGDWCDTEQWQDAWLCLVVDPEVTLSRLQREKNLCVPLLVPAENMELANNVRKCGNGLCYATSNDLLGGLKLLGENEIIYNTLLKQASSEYS
jgi:glycosyltransferase involved in cell wall biosynthesis